MSLNLETVRFVSAVFFLDLSFPLNDTSLRQLKLLGGQIYSLAFWIILQVHKRADECIYAHNILERIHNEDFPQNLLQTTSVLQQLKVCSGLLFLLVSCFKYVS